MKNALIALILASAFCSCNNNKNDKNDSMTNSGKISITESPFGNYEGKPVTAYTLTNANGMQVTVINYGGIVTKIITPDRNGKMGDVVTGFESLEGYLQKGVPYFGALVGRYANRIAHAQFSLKGTANTLDSNDHGNSLHGGNKGFDKEYWNIEKQGGDSSLRLTYTSRDGEGGYPGNLSVAVVYTLTADNSLRIDYTPRPQRSTPINLTSHSYFNLSAGKDSTILGHTLQLNANSFIPVNEKLIPTGEIKAVNGTPMDFTKAKQIGKDINEVKGGFDHNWILDKKGNELSQAAVLFDSSSGRQMEVWTTEPGIQFYSGNFLDGSLADTKNGAKYVLHGALCLETQHFPNSPNEPSFPSTILKPGETYNHTCIYKFSVGH